MIVDSVLAPADGRRPVGAASATDIGNFILAADPIHPGPDRATPITPVEIDGAKQVWELSARYAQFPAPAFPSYVPCRSRCRALAGLARARTSHDSRPRALCTPPPKSFDLTPDLCTRPMLPWAQGVVSIVSRRYFTSAPIVTFAPQHCALSGSALYAPRALIARVTVLSDQQPLNLMPARSLRTGWPRSSSLPACSRPTSGTAPAVACRQPVQARFPFRDLRKDI
jgi:hypothetical protein